MEEQTVSFDNLPSTVALILREVRELKKVVEILQPPTTGRRPILVDEACKILGKEKATVYKLARNGIIPSCKRGRKVYFFEDELLSWIASGKNKTMAEIQAEAERIIYKGTRMRP